MINPPVSNASNPAWNRPLKRRFPPVKVSAHGGHSGDFCTHARNSLEDIVREYIRRGFTWVGITEHIPPLSDAFLYPDELQASLNRSQIADRFKTYIATCRRLQKTYSGEITLYVGFETEAYSGALAYSRQLEREFLPDYIVGSVHHVNDIPFDYSPEFYRQAVKSAGGLEMLYRLYFDIQYEVITRLKPAVVGHFDLVRLHDPDYPNQLKKPAVWQRICRNLEAVKANSLMLDVNMRALFKGAPEPYPSRPVLLKALELGIPVAPSDDSHSVDTVGAFLEDGMAWLQNIGFDTDWRKPVGHAKT